MILNTANTEQSSACMLFMTLYFNDISSSKFILSIIFAYNRIHKIHVTLPHSYNCYNIIAKLNPSVHVHVHV